MPNQQKQEQVQELKELLAQYKHFVVVSYDRTSHQDMEKLRRELYNNGASMRVIKNSLFQKAIEQKALESDVYQPILSSIFPMKGSTAMIGLPEDWISALKAYDTKTAKDDSINYRFGLIDENLYQEEGMLQLAKLPSYEELMAKLIGTMKSPMIKTTFAMKFNMQRLATVLSEKAKQG